jgi:hypothetical protein
MAGHRRTQFRSRAPEGRWPSLVVSLTMSVALFVAALASMTSLPRWIRRERNASPDLPVLVQIPRTSPRTKPTTPKTPNVRRALKRSAGVPDRSQAPASEQVNPAVTAPVDPRVSSRPESTTTARDSSGARSPSAASGTAPSPQGAVIVKGAPIAPAGVNYNRRVENTPAVRDSIARGAMESFAEMARHHPATGGERDELETRSRGANSLRQRGLTAGNSRDLVILQGSGLDGVGAVSGGPGVVSVGLPLFSNGPSRAQRRKNDSLYAEYQLRLRRLQDRMYVKRDSIRADSMRADSVRRDSVARSRRAPDER